MSRTTHATALALAGAFLAGIALARPVATPSKKPLHDPNLPKPSVALGTARPPVVKAGSWQGSWYYTDRWSRLALWFDGEHGKMKVRYRYQLKGSESDEAGGYGDTGPTGTGPSSAGTGPGTLQLTSHFDPDGVVRGRIVRTWPDPDGNGEAIESNNFEAWRINNGDEMFLLFLNTVREHRSGKTVSEVQAIQDQGFTLRKVTDEIVHWEELIG